MEGTRLRAGEDRLRDGRRRLTIGRAALAACATIGAGSACADRLHLVNGHVIEGVIDKETPAQVTLDLGVGSTRIERAHIARIERSTPADNERIRAGWTGKYFLNRAFVPPGCEDLATQFRALTDRRQGAVRAHRTIADSEARERQLQAEIEGVERKLVDLSAQLRNQTPEKDVNAYNRLVTANNNVRADLTVLYHTLKTVRKTRQDAVDQVSAYLSEVTAFRESFDARTASRRTGGSDEQRFLQTLSDGLNRFEAEALVVPVGVESHGGVTIVAALINDARTGRFLVDTGAGVVTLSEAFAATLNLQAREGEARTTIALADGSSVTARYITLKSVKVGDAYVEDVPAAILPALPGKDVDGLLGMTYLRNFVIRIDGRSGQMMLTRFAPK